MALINCPECGKEISDQAKTCPGCGCPIIKQKIKRQLSKNQKLYIVLGLICIGLIIGIICYINSPKYVLKQYIKTYNKEKFDKLEKYEYTYGKDKILHTSECDYVTSYELIYKGNDEESIKRYIGRNKSYLNNDNFISYIYVYSTTYRDSDFIDDIVVGKVNGKWKIVKSQFYAPL